MISLELLNKYNVPVPRYTSYPTVPFWKEEIDVQQWERTIAKKLQEANAGDGSSLYIHLPFCESLCTYCGCNKKITTQHSVEHEYIEALKKEWKMYLRLLNGEPLLLRELHLGGGTPTFFSPENLNAFLSELLSDCTIHEDREFSFEGHPNNTTIEHLQTLYNLGFRRVSYGVQDHDATVQTIINRIQPYENVVAAVENARKIGYESVNFDLIYGLPMQNLESMKKTIEQSLVLKPDRVAFYSYAHVPWTSKAQRLFDESHLPDASLKIGLYQLGKELFQKAGYEDIGMDHFALPHDQLQIARKEGRLHRNFMGYTTQQTSTLIGLGVSSISDSGNAYAQNHKTLHDYYESIENGEWAVTKGYFLTEEDVAFKKYILDISCKGTTKFNLNDLELIRVYSINELEKLKNDGMINYDINGVQVTTLGSSFIRNICKCFDLHLSRKGSEKFSRAV